MDIDNGRLKIIDWRSFDSRITEGTRFTILEIIADRVSTGIIIEENIISISPIKIPPEMAVSCELKIYPKAMPNKTNKLIVRDIMIKVGKRFRFRLSPRTNFPMASIIALCIIIRIK